MMTRAYDESYLSDVMRNVGIMAHFCINEYGLTPEGFDEVFLRSYVSRQIAMGNPNYLVGHSGKELADIVLEGYDVRQPVRDSYYITPEYWAGWVLAYYPSLYVTTSSEYGTSISGNGILGEHHSHPV